MNIITLCEDGSVNVQPWETYSPDLHCDVWSAQIEASGGCDWAGSTWTFIEVPEPDFSIALVAWVFLVASVRRRFGRGSVEGVSAGKRDS